MPRVIERTVYRFHELSDKAKARARDHYREQGLHDQWWDYTFEGAVEVAKLLGIEIATRTVSLHNGKTREDPCIFFSGFYQQGSGAHFTGFYRSVSNPAKAVEEYAPQDLELKRIAEELALAQITARVTTSGSLSAKISSSGRGEGSWVMDFDVQIDSPDGQAELTDALERSITTPLRSFADWIYDQLETENDYLTSDEHIDEALLDGDNEFEESGALV